MSTEARTTTHRIKTRYRRGSLRITERPDCVVMKLRFDRYGVLGDEANIRARLRPLLAKYADDPRPIALHDDRTGTVYNVAGDGSHATARRCDG
jgi:hypothetical protein